MSRKKIEMITILLCLMGSFLFGVTFAAEKAKKGAIEKDHSVQRVSQPILGRYERVKIDELGGKTIKAKIDTGAYTASLNAIDIEYYQKDGEDWVRFTPVVDDKPLQTQTLPLVKISRIKQRAEEGDDSDDIASAKRPVVAMTICIGDQKAVIDVNLTNRGHFNYPLLIGAKALRELNALVDAGKRYIAPADCD